MNVLINSSAMCRLTALFVLIACSLSNYALAITDVKLIHADDTVSIIGVGGTLPERVDIGDGTLMDVRRETEGLEPGYIPEFERSFSGELIISNWPASAGPAPTAIIDASGERFDIDGIRALSDGILDEISDFFKSKASGWGTVMHSYAKTLFVALASISLIWTMGFMVLKQADIGEFFSELIKFVFTTGLFYWLLLLSTGELPAAFLASADKLALESVQANDLTFNGSTTPSSFVGYGIGLFDKIQDVPVSVRGLLTNETQFMFVSSILQHLLVLAILVILSIIAFNWMMCVITFWVQTYGAIIFLGFGGARWTSDMAINYYKNMLMVVVKLFVIILLANMGAKGINEYITQQGHDVGILGFASILIIAIAILKLATTVPDLVVAILSSRGTSGAQGVGIGTGQLAGMAVGAVATAGGAAGKGLSMLKDAVSKDKDGDK